eukprot:scaffold170222_cov19-Tisochrysis_lutea.AAC.1
MADRCSVRRTAETTWQIANLYSTLAHTHLRAHTHTRTHTCTHVYTNAYRLPPADKHAAGQPQICRSSAGCEGQAGAVLPGMKVVQRRTPDGKYRSAWSLLRKDTRTKDEGKCAQLLIVSNPAAWSTKLLSSVQFC